MKLEQQVTSLKLSKKLKELGCKQDSLFYWEKDVYANLKWHITFGNIDWEPSQMDNFNIISAFTVAELYQLHYQKFGTLSKIPVNIDPTELTDYIARKICNKLIK